MKYKRLSFLRDTYKATIKMTVQHHTYHRTNRQVPRSDYRHSSLFGFYIVERIDYVTKTHK